MTAFVRAIKLKSYATVSKRKQLKAIITRYRKQVNLFIKYIWNNRESAKLDKITGDSVKIVQNLTARYKASAHYQALNICKAKNTKSMPKFTGYPQLDAKFISINENKKAKSFDLWFKISTLTKYSRIEVPTKKHSQLNKWLAKGKLIQGCELRPDGFIVWIECEQPDPVTGLKMGIDIGMNKLISTNYGDKLGTDFNSINEKILRKQKNSASYKRAIIQKKNYINQTVNLLPWGNLEILCYENLKNLKKGSFKRNKATNIKQQHWSYRQVIDALIMKAQANRVRLVYVNPAYTSQMCSTCGNVDASSRKLEEYRCVSCGYAQDADVNGARNILRKGLDWIGSLESPKTKTKII